MCRKLIYLISFVLLLSMAGIASADLVGHWGFEEGSGSVAHDTSGNGHDGTLNGDPQWTVGKIGRALDFDGSGDYVEIERIVQDDFTLTAWIKTDTPGISLGTQGYQGSGLIWSDVGGVANDFILAVLGTKLSFFCGNPDLSLNSDTDVVTGEWVHVTATRSAEQGQISIYINGEPENTVDHANNGPLDALSTIAIGGNVGDSRYYTGLIDDVRIYDHVLSEIEILGAMEGEAWPYAYSPAPEDGTLLTIFQTGTLGYSLSWKQGGYAVSHDVYFGTDYAEVEAGTGDTFRGNQAVKYFLAGYGYMPNDPCPTGFVPGTTYYWRIDEVNDTEPNSPWKGDVWSFQIADTTAYEPAPATGSKFVDLDADLSWKAGLGAIEQTVYIGDDYDTVSTATTGGTNVGGIATTYDPGPLELETFYYWRVDTFGAYGLITGDVWSFRTLPDIPITDPNLIGWWQLDEGSGDVAVDSSGHGNHGTLYGNPQRIIGYDGDALDFDGVDDYVVSSGTNVPAGPSSFTIAAWIFPNEHNDDIITWWGQSQVQDLANGFRLMAGGQIRHYFWGNDYDITTGDLSGKWSHLALVHDGGGNRMFYLNGQQIIGSYAGTMQAPEVQATNVYIGARAPDDIEYFNGVIDDVRIYDKALTQDEIKQTMRGDPLLAWDSNPTNGSTPDIDEAMPLSWSPGDNASQHDVYFGTDQDAVEFADISDTTGIYRIRQSGTSYTPPEGVEWGGGPYYWRIDEYNTDGTISKGRVWSFTVADFINIDNIESYDAENQIWYNWVDGLGYVKPDTPPNPGNGTGSEVGDGTTVSFTEETIVHGGGKSMPFKYNNNDPFKLKYSEAKLTLSATRDWTKQDVKALSLWFQGYPASVGSFTDNFDDTYSMTGSGFDIWGQSDQFHYAYKTLTGAGTIVARIDSVSHAHDWSKAGVMIRETLDANSPHAFACVTPASGVSFQRRPSMGAASTDSTTGGITAPHWVKLERDMAAYFTVSHSTDGSSWVPVGDATAQNIPMNATVYVGLAVTAHNDGNPVPLTCEATFSNVTITGTVAGQWASQDIGIQSNEAEPMYVAIANNTGQPAVVVHDNPNAAQIDEWTEWNIDLRDFAGINLADVNSIAVGLGNRNNPQAGGSGKMYFDDFALYRPRCVLDKVTLSEADLNSDCVVDFRDLEIMTGNWLAVEPDPDVDLEADLNSDGTVDFKDYAVLADQWLDEQIWPGL